MATKKKATKKAAKGRAANGHANGAKKPEKVNKIFAVIGDEDKILAYATDLEKVRNKYAGSGYVVRTFKAAPGRAVKL